jgi:predicted DNA-binding transcriptional regulator YafY
MPRRKQKTAGRCRSLMRVLTLIGLLQQRRPRTLRRLAEKLDVNERTIQRDGVLAQAGFRVRHTARKFGLRVFWLPRTR